MREPPHMFCVLDEHNQVVPSGAVEWAIFFESSDRRIVAQHEGETFRLSTVFIGLPDPRSLIVGRPCGTFETALWVTGHLTDTWRHDTWDQAQAFHMEKFVELAEKELADR